MLMLASLAAVGSLSQAASAPLPVDVVVDGREVRVEIPGGGWEPLPGSAILRDGEWRYLLNARGRAFARVADRGGWSDLAALHRRAEQRQGIEPVVWRVKAFVFRRWDDLMEAGGLLRQVRATLEPSRLQFVLQSLGRLAVAAKAFSGGQIRLEIDVDVEEPAIDRAFLQNEAARFVAARTNRGEFEAEDRVFRGPYDLVLLLAAQPEGMRLESPRIPGVRLVAVSAEAEAGEESAMLARLLDAWAASLADGARAHGWGEFELEGLTVDTPSGPYSDLPAVLSLGPFARSRPAKPAATEAWLQNVAGGFPLAGCGMGSSEAEGVRWAEAALAAAHPEAFPTVRVVRADPDGPKLGDAGRLPSWLGSREAQPNSGPDALPVRAATPADEPGTNVEPSKDPGATAAARAAYAWRIARSGQAEPGDAALLVRWIAERDDSLRIHACRALQRVPDPAALPQLAALFLEFNPRVAEEAVKAVAAIGTPEAWEVLRRGAMFGRYDHTREACARELGRTGDPRHASAISTLLSTRSWRSREAGARALAGLKEPMAQMMALAFLSDVDPLVRLAVVEGVDVGLDAVCRRLLWLSVNDPSDQVRMRSMLRLMQSPKAEFQNEGLKGVRDESRGVRLGLARAFAEIPEALRLRAAQFLLADSDPTVRAAAVGPAPAAALESVWGDADPRVQLALAERAKLEELPVPPGALEAWVRSIDPRVARAAQELRG
ncbi:MAG: HEAT repeat domain-containing protein [Fimbriimonadales bacterium]|nr:HEAT repeat domain-containing protein [Fimbriimonadales bacterium]